MRRELDISNFLLLNAGRADHFRDWNWKGVNSPFTRIWMVREGTASITVGTETYLLEPGYLHMIPPFTTHHCRCEGRLSLCYIHLYEQPSAGIPVMDDFDFPFRVPVDPLVGGLVERLLEINPRRELPGYDPESYDNPHGLLRGMAGNMGYPYHRRVETHGILCLLLSRFLERANRRVEMEDGRLREVIRHISGHIDNSISLGELSAIAHCTDDHLIRIFKQKLNYTPIEYINLRKIEKAQLMLLTEESSVGDIASSLSFYDTSYFIRLFKRLTGMTPLEYRRSKHQSKHP
jgi:AraC-like DNA-binding protein